MNNISIEDAIGIIGFLALFCWIAWFLGRIRQGKVKSNRQLEMDILRRKKK